MIQNLKEWLAYFKDIQPKVISISDVSSRITQAAYLAENEEMNPSTLYIGNLSQAVFRFRMWEGMSLFLINDMGAEFTAQKGLGIENKQVDCQNNNIILIKDETLEDVYNKCRNFLKIQESVKDAANELLQVYLNDNTLLSVLNKTEELIHNPVMMLDQNYRVIAYSKLEKCEDAQWEECIANGYCSYEFISRFNQLNEIRSSQKEIVPFFAGCMMSPMRRCISKIFFEKKQIGYLISIESSSPFDETSLQLIEIASKLLAKQIRIEKKTDEKDFHSVWDILNYAIEGRKGSIEVLRRYLRESGFYEHEQYYMIRVNMEEYTSHNYSTDRLNHTIREVFPKCVFSYYDNYIIILAQSKENLREVKKKIYGQEDFILTSNIKVTISDPFDELENLSRNDKQTQRAMELLKLLDHDKIIATYDEYRRYDMMIFQNEQGKDMLSKSQRNQIPLFIGTKEEKLYQYDKEHQTDYFKTAYVYSQHSRSLKETAKQLHVHKNTISYRVSRLKELFEIDLNQAKVRINLCLAYEAFRLIEAGL